MQARLRPDGPLDPALTLHRYRAWGEDPVTAVGPDGVLRRAVRAEGRWHGYEVRWQGGPDDLTIGVRVPASRRIAPLEAAVAETRRLLGLDQPVEPFYRTAKGDRVLSDLVGRLHGLRPTLAPLPLEMLVGAISAQQVNLAFAFAVRARLVRRFGTPVEVGGHVVHGFPDAAVLARARPVELRALQFTVRKGEYIVGLARLVATGALDLDGLVALDNATVIETLTAVRGLGRWTAEWFLARCLGRGDVCPAGDLGVRRAFEHFYGRGRELGEEAIRRRARPWGAHQSLAVHYLLAGQRLAAARSGGGDA